AGEGLSIAAAVQAINAYSDETGVVASRTDAGALQLVAEDGRNIAINEVMATNGANGGAASDIRSVFSGTVAGNGTTDVSVNSTETYRGQLTLSSSDSITFGANQAAAGFSGTTTLLEAQGNLSTQNELGRDAANNTILAVDSAF